MQGDSTKTVRIREIGGEWRIEQDGASIAAPFPLTNVLAGTGEYAAATEDSVQKFMRQFYQGRGELPPALLDTARRIAQETDCAGAAYTGRAK